MTDRITDTPAGEPEVPDNIMTLVRAALTRFGPARVISHLSALLAEARKASMRRLPPAVRAELEDLFQAGATIDQVVAKLRELGHEVSRSAVGRYAKSIKEIGERLRRSRSVAEALVQQLGKEPEQRTARLNIEFLHTIILDVMAGGEDGQPVTLDPEAVMLMAKALHHLAAASKSDADRELKIRAEIAKQLLAEQKKAAETAASEAREMGMSENHANFIRAKILGIKLPDAAHG